MKLKNRRTIIIIVSTLLGISIFVGVLSVFGAYWLLNLPEIVFTKYSQYPEINASKLIVYLEDRYSFAFPPEIFNIKAGKAYGSINGSSSFIIRFDVPNDKLEPFIYSLGSIDEVVDYTERLDWRLKYKNYPDWYKVPIVQGKILTVQAKAINLPDVNFMIELYIDTSNEKNSVVYMEGNYKSEDG